MQTKIFADINRIAKLFKTSPKSIHRRCELEENPLPFFFIGRKMFFLISEVKKWKEIHGESVLPEM